MSTEQPGFSAVPIGPPWTVDVLADLHAGVYPDDVSADLRRRIGDDPEAMAVMAALDSTVDDLSLMTAPRMPERFALRLDAAIAAESAARTGARPADRPPGFQPTFAPGPPRLTSVPTGPPAYRSPQQFLAPPPARPVPDETSTNVTSLDAARSKRRRWVTGLAVAAAVAAIGTITVTSLNRTPTGGTQAIAPFTTTSSSSSAAAGGAPGNPAPDAGGTALTLEPGKFQAAVDQLSGGSDGPLTNPITSAGCYAANNIKGDDILGVKQVSYLGKQASAVLVQVSQTKATVYVLGLTCGVNGAKDFITAETVDR